MHGNRVKGAKSGVGNVQKVGSLDGSGFAGPVGDIEQCQISHSIVICAGYYWQRIVYIAREIKAAWLHYALVLGHLAANGSVFTMVTIMRVNTVVGAGKQASF